MGLRVDRVGGAAREELASESDDGMIEEAAAMARKPNYDFERRERERAKAAKVAERTKAKAEKGERPAEPQPTEGQVSPEEPGR